MFAFLHRKKEREELLIQAETALQFLKTTRQTIENEKLDLLHRQVELWAIGDLSSELETKYRSIATEITYIEKKLITITDLTTKLLEARIQCRDFNNSQTLKMLLPLSSNIFADLDPTIPVVNYTISRRTI